MLTFECRVKHILLLLIALPMAAQAWDFRIEKATPKGQGLPEADLPGAGQRVSEGMKTGDGGIFSISHRIVRVGPVLRLEWGIEAQQWTTEGNVHISNYQPPRYETKLKQSGAGLGHVDFSNPPAQQKTKLKQSGAGLGLNVQLFLPFTGLCGELGAIQRVQQFDYVCVSEKVEKTITRTWLRAGVRWRLPLIPAIHPYVAVSYQKLISKPQSSQTDSVTDFATYLEFQQAWTLGVGFTF